MQADEYVRKVQDGLRRSGWTEEQTHKARSLIILHRTQGVAADRSVCLLDLFHKPVVIAKKSLGA
jgi:hypothetical protein